VSRRRFCLCLGGAFALGVGLGAAGSRLWSGPARASDAEPASDPIVAHAERLSSGPLADLCRTPAPLLTALDLAPENARIWQGFERLAVAVVEGDPAVGARRALLARMLLPYFDRAARPKTATLDALRSSVEALTR
jgi:hypothetical protein